MGNIYRIPFLGSGESARSDGESVKHGSVNGDPSHTTFPVTVVVDETKENHIKSNNIGSPFEQDNGSSEQMNVANGGGLGVPNGNSHKGQTFILLFFISLHSSSILLPSLLFASSSFLIYFSISS